MARRAPGRTPLSQRKRSRWRSVSASSVIRSTVSSCPAWAWLSGIGLCASGAGMPGMGLPCGQVLGMPSCSASRSSTTGESACSRRCASSWARGNAGWCGEPLLHHGRERVLEAMRLVVGARPVEPEHVGQPALEQAMTARHGLGDAAALRGEADLLLAREADVALALHAPERLGDGRRGDVHVPREPRADDGLVAAREVVDRAEIVLDGRSGFHGPRIPDGPGSGKPRRRRPSWGTIGAEDSPMDFALTEAQEMIRKEVAALARGFSLDYWLEKDEKAEYPYEFIKAFADAGSLRLQLAAGSR